MDSSTKLMVVVRCLRLTRLRGIDVGENYPLEDAVDVENTTVDETAIASVITFTPVTPEDAPTAVYSFIAADQDFDDGTRDEQGQTQTADAEAG